MEDFQERLARYLDEDGVNIFGWMTIWAQNELVVQIGAVNKPNFETLLFLGTHGFMQTFMESAYHLRGVKATKAFLERFMDETPAANQFSLIADKIHEMRNVLAHQLYARHTHDIAYDYQISLGWEQHGDVLHVNPTIYGKQFISAVDGGRLRKWRNWTTPDSLVRQKWRFVVKWLDLRKDDDIAKAVKTLLAGSPQDIVRGTPAVRKLFAARYFVRPGA
jgi:hypothetical protein